MRNSKFYCRRLDPKMILVDDPFDKIMFGNCHGGLSIKEKTEHYKKNIEVQKEFDQLDPLEQQIAILKLTEMRVNKAIKDVLENGNVPTQVNDQPCVLLSPKFSEEKAYSIGLGDYIKRI